jgi:ribosomal protein S18 acetylase RimI-like enzyme
MPVREITPAALARIRSKLIRFIKIHSDKRITSQAIRWFTQLPEQALMEPGTLILVYIENKKLVGCIAVGEYGRQESFLVVHKAARTNGIGMSLTKAALERLEKLYVRIAADNTASLKTCFAAGMVAFACIRGVTGKPTLWLAAGDWSREDVRIQ